MSNKFQIKRTSVSTRTPNTTNSANASFIDAGELAINMPDGKLFSSNGSALFEVGANLINLNVTSNATLHTTTAGNTTVNGSVTINNNSHIWAFNADGTTSLPGFSLPATDGANGQILITNGAGGVAWANITPATVTYTANTISLTDGVYISGNVQSIQTYGDYGTGGYYNFTDGTNAGPAWILDVGFVSVVDFNRVVLNINYTQNSGHTVYVQLYNYTTSQWDSLGSYNGLSGYYQFALAVLDSTPYVSAGAVSLRLYHNNTGNALHETRVDYIALEKSLQGPQGPRGPTGNTGANGVSGTAGIDFNAANSYTWSNTQTFSNVVTFSNTINVSSLSVVGNASVGGNMLITGNLQVLGSTVTISTSSLGIHDNMLYLNQSDTATITNAVGNGSVIVYTANNTFDASDTVRVTGITPSGLNTNGYVSIVAVNSTSFSVSNTATDTYTSGGSASAKVGTNPDIGIAANYNDGTYAHTGIFRDATDARWKVFDSYTPEPDASIYIDTANASFHLADFQANTIYAVGGVLTGSLTVNTFFIANSTVVTVNNLSTTGTLSLTANGSLGTNGQFLASNGSVAYWQESTGLAVYNESNTLLTTVSAVIATNIDDLADVDTSTVAPANNDVLMWDQALLVWKPNSSLAAAAAAATTAYSNAIAFSANADNITSGTITGARLPAANVTTAGGVILLDSVSNTSVATYAPTMNAVKTAYDLAGNAVANAVTAYTNATAFAANADNIASGTIAGARLPAANVTTAGGVILVDSVSNTSVATYAPTMNAVKTAYDLAGNAVANAISYAATAYTNATSFAANASNISTGTLANGRLAATIDVVTGLNIGTTVSLTTAAISIGNSTVNTQITPGNIALNGSTLTIGSGLNNTTITGTSMSVSGALTTGNVNIIGTANISANLTASNIRLTGDLQVDGNLTVTGTSVTLNVASLSVEDNMIYLNGGSAVSHPDLGIAGNYNDGSYKHAGMFRDATDGRWKFFHGYTPEPDASAYIDTANASFTLSNVQAHTFIGAGSLSTLDVGNTIITGSANVSSTLQVTGVSTFGNTMSVAGLITGTITLANNASNLGGVAAASYAGVANSSPRKTSSISSVNSSTWTTVCNVDGDNLASVIRATFNGTSDSVVVNVVADILVNHAGDIVVRTTSGFYTVLQLRIISDGNANFTLQVKHNGSSSTTLYVEIYPLNSETITFSPGTLYTTTTFDHTCSYGSAHSGTGGYNHNIITDGTFAAGNTTITGFANVSSTLQVGTNTSTFGTAAYIVANGNVGVGISSPVSKLHVRGDLVYLDKTGTTEPTIRFRSSNDSYQSEWGLGHRASSNDFALRYFNGSAWSEAYAFAANGNLGINTATPAAKLDIKMSGDGDIFVGRHSASSSKLVYAYQSSSDGYLELRTGADNIVTKLSGYAATPSYFLSRVGIGNSSPSYMLDVTGQTRIGVNVTQAAPSSTDILSTAAAMIGGQGGNYLSFGQFGSSNNYAQWIQSSYQNPTSAIYNLILNPLGGNVGVGNSSPSYKLHIQGDIYASGNVYSASDRRLKTDIEIIDDPIGRVLKLNGIFYRALNDTNRSTGILAQDALEALPEVVTTNSEGYYGVNYGNIVGLLIEAIKKQQEQIDSLQKRLSGSNGVSQ